MAIAINPHHREVYILGEDRTRPDEERTEFILRPVTAGDFADIARKAEGDMFLADLAFAGIVGWNNLRDADGKVVAYSPSAARERLAIRWIRELATEVARLSRVTEQDEKNLESPQPSSAAR